MPQNIVLLIVLASQTLFVSGYFPFRLIRRVRYIVETYPPSSHPKLYPVSVDAVHRTLRAYRAWNLFNLAVGLALVASGFLIPRAELLGWDSQSVVLLYFLLQNTPLLLVSKSPGFAFFNPAREPGNRRSAELRRRSVLDFVSPVAIALAAAIYVGFVLFVVFAPQYWPGGYWNVFGVTVMNAVCVIMAFRSVYGRKKDPYLAERDRLVQIGLTVKLAVFMSIAGTTFLVITMGLQRMQDGLADIAASLFYQAIILANLHATRVDKVDFEVYRGNGVAEPGSVNP